WLRRGGRVSRTGWFVLKKLLNPYSDLIRILVDRPPRQPKAADTPPDQKGNYSGSPPWLRRGGRVSRTGWFVLRKLVNPYLHAFFVRYTNIPIPGTAPAVRTWISTLPEPKSTSKPYFAGFAMLCRL